MTEIKSQLVEMKKCSPFLLNKPVRSLARSGLSVSLRSSIVALHDCGHLATGSLTRPVEQHAVHACYHLQILCLVSSSYSAQCFSILLSSICQACSEALCLCAVKMQSVMSSCVQERGNPWCCEASGNSIYSLN